VIINLINHKRVNLFTQQYDLDLDLDSGFFYCCFSLAPTVEAEVLGG